MSNVQNTEALVASFVASNEIKKIALGKKSKHVKLKSKNVSSPSVDETTVSSPNVDETTVSSPNAHSVAVTQTVNVAIVAKSERYARTLLADRARFAEAQHFKARTAKAVIYQTLLDAYARDEYVTISTLHAQCVKFASTRADRTLASFASDISDVAVRIKRVIDSRKNSVTNEREYKLADI